MAKRLSRWILKFFGWQIEGVPDPFPPKAVIAVVPHTSNWDFLLGLLTRSALGVDIRYLGKHTLFLPPFGWLFRWLGGYPVDRRQRTHLVDTVVDIFNRHDRFLISIAPEGTRKKVSELRSGFYFMARKAGVPILPCSFNFRTRTVAFHPLFHPGPDPESDLRLISDAFRGIPGKYPQNSF